MKFVFAQKHGASLLLNTLRFVAFALASVPTFPETTSCEKSV